jgi:hypothetical protein
MSICVCVCARGRIGESAGARSVYLRACNAVHVCVCAYRKRETR